MWEDMTTYFTKHRVRLTGKSLQTCQDHSNHSLTLLRGKKKLGGGRTLVIFLDPSLNSFCICDLERLVALQDLMLMHCVLHSDLDTIMILFFSFCVLHYISQPNDARINLLSIVINRRHHPSSYMLTLYIWQRESLKASYNFL